MSDPIIKRGLTRTVIGVEVSEMEITLLGGDGATLANMPVGAFALAGGFDGAEVEVVRDFAPSWDQPSCGSLNIFSGRIGDIQITSTEVVMTALSGMELLNVPLPRNVYQASCMRTLYSAECGVDPEAFTNNYSAASSGNTRFIIRAEVAFDTGYYDLGVIEFITGLNAGQKRTVKTYTQLGGDDGQFRVMLPWPYIPQSGDEFRVRPGCNKLQETCDVTFNNLENFRGFPYIPVPESTI